MRALRPMTQEEREFAEQKHDLVIDFLRYRHLSMDDYYDIVIFGYLSAVQQYFRDPPPNVAFEAMGIRAMKDSLLREGEYYARAKRCGITVSLNDAGSILTDPRQDTERRVTNKVLLEQIVNTATPQEARIINLLMDGFVLREAAQRLKMPIVVAAGYMEDFCCRNRIAVW